MTDLHRSKSTISFQRVLVMHAQALGSNIITFYQLGDIDGLACLGVSAISDQVKLKRDRIEVSKIQ